MNPGKEQFKQVNSGSASTIKQKCERCNRPPHTRMKCPARDWFCNNYGRKGHWKKACRSKTVSQVTAELQDTTQQIDESFFLGEVIEAIHSDERGNQPWKAEVLVNISRVSFKLNSGADITVISLDLYEKLCNQSGELQPSNKVLMGPCRQQIDCVGKIRVTLHSNKHTFNEDVYVVKNLDQPLSGCTAGASLKLIIKVNTIESVKSPVDNNPSKQSKGAHTANNEQAANSSVYKAEIVTSTLSKLFKALGDIQGEYEIKLRDNAQPFALYVPRKVPLPPCNCWVKPKLKLTEC